MLEPVQPPRLDNCSTLFPGYEVDVLRLDIIHPLISGNKWYKLKYFLLEALHQQAEGIATRGGPWSNHILAAAAAANALNLRSLGVIRGEQPARPSPMLQDAAGLGMQLSFQNREEYDEGKWPAETANYFMIPEGGMGATGARGAAEIIQHVDYDHYLCAAGTTTMLAGISNKVPGKTLGISIVNPAFDHKPALKNMLHPGVPIPEIIQEGKGYGRYDRELLEFMNDWYKQTSIPSDIVYTGKMFKAATALLRNNYFSKGSRVLLIHSGGLQGNRSLKSGSLIF